MKALKIGNLLAPVPIVQGGMGVGISLAGLASAVADQGGIGVISSAGLGVIYKDYSKDYRTASIWGLKQELKKAREATKGIVGVNVMVAMSNFADMVRTAIAEGGHHLLGRRAAAQPAVVRLPKEPKPNWHPSYRRRAPRNCCARNGLQNISTFPTPSWSKAPRRAATSA